MAYLSIFLNDKHRKKSYRKKVLPASSLGEAHSPTPSNQIYREEWRKDRRQQEQINTREKWKRLVMVSLNYQSAEL